MITAIITAAGSGTRAGLKFNKVLYRTADGKTVLEHAILPFTADARISEIIVTATDVDVQIFSEIASRYENVKIVKGGSTRSESVKKAVNAASGDIVIIHDGARPFLSEKSVYKCINDVLTFGSSVSAVACVNTIGETKNGNVVNTGRKNRCEIQTPQGFFKNKLKEAFEAADENEIFTDEAGIYCKYVSPVHITEGEETNVKLTYPEDFEKLTPHRVGNGYDLHVLTEGRKLVIGGVEIPHTKGLLGHSDADVLLHAITDAIFSAAGLRDIGYYFSDKDPAYEGISSIILLEKANRMIREKGFRVYNLSAVIMAENPKLNPFVPQMKENIAKTLSISPEMIGITCTTSEKVGFIGREEGIAVSAICSLAQFF